MTLRLAAILCGALLFVAWGCDQDTSKKGTDGGKGATAAAGGLKELKITDTHVGKGATAEKGDKVYVVYTGRLKDGTTFDSNNKPSGTPYSFVLGDGPVIEGWHKGLVGMRVGGDRHLEIPSKMAYGDQAAPGGTIPAGSDLYFDVRLLDVVKKGEENVYDKKDLKVGSGAEATNGSKITIHYKASLVNGHVFDDTHLRDKPETFKLGNEEVIKGLDYGLVGMKVGGKRQLRIPPDIGYGTYGLNGVAADSVVIFEVELLKVEKG